jgi:hypothetical protein
MNWTAIIAIINFAVVLCGAVVAVLGIRQSVSRAASDIQERVRKALEDENKLLTDRFNRLEMDNKELHKTLKLIVLALKKTYNIELDIDDGIITLRDQTGKSTAQNTKDEETP